MILLTVSLFTLLGSGVIIGLTLSGVGRSSQAPTPPFDRDSSLGMRLAVSLG